MKITLKKIEQGVCPYCGSRNIEYGFSEFQDDMVEYDAHCIDCNRTFEEWYSLKFVGHNVGNNGEIETNEGEEGIEIEMDE